jgi:hypothetical protein
MIKPSQHVIEKWPTLASNRAEFSIKLESLLPKTRAPITNYVASVSNKRSLQCLYVLITFTNYITRTSKCTTSFDGILCTLTLMVPRRRSPDASTHSDGTINRTPALPYLRLA